MNLRESKTSGTEMIAFAIASDGLVTLRVSFTSILMHESGNTNMLHRCLLFLFFAVHHGLSLVNPDP